MKRYLIIITLISLFHVNLLNGQVSDQCIGCICFAGNGCKKDVGCNEAGVCGPLLITWAYWADAGKYVIKGMDPNDPNAYPQCANDLYCAAETVRAYMAKFQRDCNEDGRINCDDYARIHRRGPGYCQDPNFVATPFYQEFAKCNAQTRP